MLDNFSLEMGLFFIEPETYKLLLQTFILCPQSRNTTVDQAATMQRQIQIIDTGLDKILQNGWREKMYIEKRLRAVQPGPDRDAIHWALLSLLIWIIVH